MVPPPRRPPSLVTRLSWFLLLALFGYAIVWWTGAAGISLDEAVHLWREVRDAWNGVHVHQIPQASSPSPRSPPTMPDVVGWPASEAERELRSRGLKVHITSQVKREVAEGRVLEQEPSPGGPIRADRSADIIVNHRPPSPPLPNFKGQPFPSVQETLKGMGLKAELHLQHDMRVRPQEVLRTIPVAGSRLRPGGTVAVIVSAGPPTGHIVPDLIGLSFYNARSQAGRAGLAVEVESVGKSEDEDVVKEQEPAPGSEITDAVVRVVLGPPPSPSPSPSASASPSHKLEGHVKGVPLIPRPPR